MTTTFAQPILPETPEPAAFALLHSIFIEPVLVVASCLFWLVALPISGLFCLGVALFDKLVVFPASKIRLLDLRPTANPLVLRRSAASDEKVPTQARPGTQAIRA